MANHAILVGTSHEFKPFSGQACHPVIGEELLIPAGAIHSVRNIGATTARWLYGYKL